MSPNIRVEMSRIKEFCKKWSVIELALFGSVLRPDFRPESDIDILIGFSSDARWNLFDLVEMREELMEIFGRDVDLVEKGTVRNPFRRHSIMTTREVLYAA